MPSRLRIILGVMACVCLSLSGSQISSQTASYEAQLVEKAKKLKLASKTHWRNMLYITPGWFKKDTSILDSSISFLSPEGKSNPEKELTATLKAFFWSKDKKGKLYRHPQCAFPARYKWLDKKLSFNPKKMKRMKCPDLKEWLREIDSDRVSMIFSSYYLNNPASLFGHTFLRLHRKKGSGPAKSVLLDPAVDFSAYPDTGNPILYVLKGLFGGFPGRFNVMPYYIKVQKYNNHESRDMWEYELNFSPEQIKWLMLSLWEVSQAHADYYYLDDNCSYVILALLKIADPKLKLLEPFNSWVVPADTLRVVLESGDLLREIRYRPSALSRFLTRYKHLINNETDVVANILDDEQATQVASHLKNLKTASKARIIDAALEYIDFKEKLATEKEPTTFLKLRMELLKHRSKVPTPSLPIKGRPERERPDLGHDAMRIGLLGGSNPFDGVFSEFELRPVLHDLGSSSLGYLDQLQLAFFETHFRYSWKNNHFMLSKFDVLQILSLAPFKPLLAPMSWRIALGWESQPLCQTTQGTPCRRLRFQGGVGFTFYLWKDWIQFYSFVLGDIGFANETGQGFHIGPGLQAGLVWSISDSFRWIGHATALRRFGSISKTDFRMESDLTFIISRVLETRARLKYYDENIEYGLAFYYYF